MSEATASGETSHQVLCRVRTEAFRARQEVERRVLLDKVAEVAGAIFDVEMEYHVLMRQKDRLAEFARRVEEHGAACSTWPLDDVFAAIRNLGAACAKVPSSIGDS